MRQFKFKIFFLPLFLLVVVIRDGIIRYSKNSNVCVHCTVFKD